jgi:hypothetical protein
MNLAALSLYCKSGLREPFSWARLTVVLKMPLFFRESSEQSFLDRLPPSSESSLRIPLCYSRLMTIFDQVAKIYHSCPSTKP